MGLRRGRLGVERAAGAQNAPSPAGPWLMGRRGWLRRAARPLQAYFFAGVAAGAAAVLELPVLFFAAGLVECFLVCFFTLGVEAAGVALPLGGGVAGACAANVKGIVAKARAMVIKVVFISFSPFLRALDDARSQSHHAAGASKTR
jgi:hypothetical protein